MQPSGFVALLVLFTLETQLCGGQPHQAEINIVQTRVLEEDSLSVNFIGAKTSKARQFSSRHLTVSDFSCNNTLHLFVKLAKRDNLDYHNKWLIFTESFDNLVEEFRMVKFRMDSDIIVASQDTMQMYDVYNPGYGSGGTLSSVPIGSWNESLTLPSMFEKRKVMTEVDLKVAVKIANASPFNPDRYLEDFRNQHLDNVQKLNYALLNLIKEVHGFKVKLVVAKKWEKDSYYSTEPSMAEMLQSGGVDFAATSIFMSPEMVRKYDFLPSTYTYRTCFLFRNPGNFEEYNEFVEPMSSEVWYATLGCTLIVIILLRLVFIGDKYIYKDGSEIVKINYEEGKEWSAVVSDTLSILIQQGSTYEPNCVSGKIILFSYLTLGLLLFNYYTSVMVSNLLSLPLPPFKSIEQLSTGSISMSVENNDLVLALLQESKNPDLKYLSHSTISSFEIQPELYGIEEGISKLEKEAFAFYTHADSAYALIRETFSLKQICDVDEISIMSPKDMYVVIPKKSQYKELFTISYRKLSDSGLFRRVSNRWLTKRLPCLANRDILDVGLLRCMSVFYIFIFGCSLSLLFLLLERYRATTKFQNLKTHIRNTARKIIAFNNCDFYNSD